MSDKQFSITTANVTAFTDILTGKDNDTSSSTKYLDIIRDRNININSLDIGDGRIIRYFSGDNVCVRGANKQKQKIYLSTTDLYTHYVQIHTSDKLSHLANRFVYNKMTELGFTYPNIRTLCENSQHHCSKCLDVALSRVQSNKARKCDKLIVSNYELHKSDSDYDTTPTSSPQQYTPPQTQTLQQIDDVQQFIPLAPEDCDDIDNMEYPPLFERIDKLTRVVTDVTTAAMGMDALSLTSAELLCSTNLPLMPLYANDDYVLAMGLFTNKAIQSTGTCYIILCVDKSLIIPTTQQSLTATPELQNAITLAEFNENYPTEKLKELSEKKLKELPIMGRV